MGNGGEIGAQSRDDRFDLERVDAPHPQEAKLSVGSSGVACGGCGVAQVEGDVMRGYEPVRESGRDELRLGAGHESVIELTR